MGYSQDKRINPHESENEIVTPLIESTDSETLGENFTNVLNNVDNIIKLIDKTLKECKE